MTKTEMADLEIAIGLITGLRDEMTKGFNNINMTLGEVRESQAAHLAVHADRDNQVASRGVSKRWVIGVVTTASISIIGIILTGVYRVLGI